MEITSCDLITKQRNVKTQFSEIHVPKKIVLQSQTSDAAFGFDLIFFYLGHTYTTIKKEKNISTIKLSDNEENCQLSSAFFRCSATNTKVSRSEQAALVMANRKKKLYSQFKSECNKI